MEMGSAIWRWQTIWICPAHLEMDPHIQMRAIILQMMGHIQMEEMLGAYPDGGVKY